jgi:hypothetical protein
MKDKNGERREREARDEMSASQNIAIEYNNTQSQG